MQSKHIQLHQSKEGLTDLLLTCIGSYAFKAVCSLQPCLLFHLRYILLKIPSLLSDRAIAKSDVLFGTGSKPMPRRIFVSAVQ